MANEASKIEILHEGQKGEGFCAPVVKISSAGVPHLFFASSQTGQISERALVDDPSNPAEVVDWQNTEGQPSGLAWDTKEDVLYVTDIAHQAVMTLAKDGTAVKHVGEYEKKKLKGPSAAAFDKKGNLFFTDSGDLGDTSLASPTGSVFIIEGSPSGTLLKPLALECLAHPCALTVADNGVVYVCETLRNRILRFVRTDTGAFIASIFAQFSGLLGPTGVACQQQEGGSHRVIVARSGIAGADESSLLAVMDARGKPVEEINIPSASCSGLTIGPSSSAYVTTDNCVYKIKI